MLDVILESLSALFSGGRLAYLGLGVLLGVVVGVLPGLGGIVGFSILLPFLYGMEPAAALAMLIGMVAVAVWSAVATYVIVLLSDAVAGLRTSSDDEIEGLDFTAHGERGYHS